VVVTLIGTSTSLMKMQTEQGKALTLSGDQPSAVCRILIFGKTVTGPQRPYLPLSFCRQ